MDEKQFKILTSQLNEIIQVLGTTTSKYVPPSKREKEGETLNSQLTRIIQLLEKIANTSSDTRYETDKNLKDVGRKIEETALDSLEPEKF